MHDGRIVTCACHYAETEALPICLNLSQIEIERLHLACHPSKSVRLVRREKVVCEKVRSSGREGEHRDARICKSVRDCCNRPIATSNDNCVKIFCILHELCHIGCSVCAPQSVLVTILANHAEVIVYRSIAEPSSYVDDDEQFHEDPNLRRDIALMI